MHSREITVVTVEADRSEMGVLVIVLCLSTLEVSYIYNCFADDATYRQITFAVPVGNACVLPSIAFLNPSVFAVVISASGLFHNSVLVAAPSVSCLPVLVYCIQGLEADDPGGSHACVNEG